MTNLDNYAMTTNSFFNWYKYKISILHPWGQSQGNVTTSNWSAYDTFFQFSYMSWSHGMRLDPTSSSNKNKIKI